MLYQSSVIGIVAKTGVALFEKELNVWVNSKFKRIRGILDLCKGVIRQS